MAQDQPPFRYRTILEIAAISLVIYFLLGTPGLPSPSSPSPSSSSTSEHLQDKDKDTFLSKTQTESLVTPNPNLQCGAHAFKAVHIFSTSPLVVYIDGFLSASEADHLVEISADKWQPSTIFNRGVEESDDKVRKSEKARIDRDEIVQCIEARALAFQGWPQKTSIERLWTQRYNVSGHYAHHYDWASASKAARRASTFMVYLSSGEECEGGGTNFPRLHLPDEGMGRWCEFVECPQVEGSVGEGSGGGGGEVGAEGVTFRVRKGAAVFWTNFDAEGRGYKETIHAGMPVRRGTKIGLNIWSWYQA